MIERHYDEDALVTMLASGGASAADPHLSACGECTGKLDTFRLVTEALRDVDTWDKREVAEAPNPNTLATLRNFADTMAAEDSVADAFLTNLLAGPRETWIPTLAAHPEYRTAGTVRRLIAATDRALDTMPADAVELTALAVEIAENLSTYRPDTLARLRGSAWRERAYALFYTGQFAEAEKAVELAERAFEGCVVAEYEQARVGIVRAVVERGLENYDSAVSAARLSAQRFADFDDVGRMVSARVAEAQLQFNASRYAEAFDALSELDAQLAGTNAAQAHAIVLGNLGYSAWKLGRIADAIQYHEAAAALLADLGMRSDAVRSRWNIASILASDGRIDEALRRLWTLRDEFTVLGMVGASTDVALEIAELLVTRGEYAQAEQICRAAMHDIEGAGLSHTAPALTALAILDEAVSNRTVTPAAVQHVRKYLRRLPDEPALLFAPAPPE